MQSSNPCSRAMWIRIPVDALPERRRQKLQLQIPRQGGQTQCCSRHAKAYHCNTHAMSGTSSDSTAPFSRQSAAHSVNTMSVVLAGKLDTNVSTLMRLKECLEDILLAASFAAVITTILQYTLSHVSFHTSASVTTSIRGKLFIQTLQLVAFHVN